MLASHYEVTKKQHNPCFFPEKTVVTYAGCGVRTHAHLCAEDLKSSPLTSRANQLIQLLS